LRRRGLWQNHSLDYAGVKDGNQKLRSCKPREWYLKNLKKIQFEENFCYLEFKKTIAPQKAELLRDILPGRQVAKPIFNHR